MDTTPKIVKRYKNFYWVQISDPTKLTEEGIASSNCLALDQCSYREDAVAGTVQLFFLKDYAGKTHESATYIPKLNVMEDVESYGSGAPKYEHADYILDLLDMLNPTRTHNIRMKIACYTKVNGKWMNAQRFYPNLIVNHSLNLNNFNQLFTLPTDMTVRGDLRICKTQISSLPNRLTVHKDLDIRYTTIRTLPETLNVRGNVLSLPNQLL